MPVRPSVTLEQIRLANRARLPKFKNSAGVAYHTAKDGEEWSVSDWYMATAGELGELGNLLKKRLRGDDIPQWAIEEELADVLHYLDILALRLGVQLGIAAVNKFNKVSEKQNINVKLKLDVDGCFVAYDGNMPAEYTV